MKSHKQSASRAIDVPIHDVRDASVVAVVPKVPTLAVTPISLTDRLKIVVVMLLALVGVYLISSKLLIHNSLRLDEAQSLWQTSHSVAGTLKVVAQDVHVPLYHLILHFWQIGFGQTIEAARALSLVFFMATIPVVYLLARRILSINWSLFTVLLFSFSPFVNWYGNEARMYALLGFISTLSQLFFVKLIQSRGKRGWLGYSLTAFIGVYAHYFFLFNLLTQGIYFLITRKNFVKGTILKFTALAGVIAVELLPWFLYFRSLGSASNTSPNLHLPSTVDFFNVYSQFLFGFQNDALNTILLSLWPLLVVVALLSVKNGQRLTPKTGYILIAGLLPVVIAYIISLTITPFFVSRYMIACLPPLLIFGVWLLSNYRKPLYIALSGLFILTLIGTSAQEYFSKTTPVKEDFKTAAQMIGHRSRASDIVVLSAPFTIYPFNYYYNGDARVTTLPIWDRSVPGAVPAFEDSKLESQVKQINANHQYVYLLLSSDQGYQTKIFQYYERHFENTASHQFSPDLQLQVYRVGYSIAKPASEL